ncbi:eukaryotic translation initiation factor 4G-like isoform X1 [Typha latifolia]|uniref:eukaryotic translation initiation factor 4G-like isoform X1 n=1 Tax=Typha latifolia TaxID=4733 RepID=UPI003C2E51D6
MSFNQSRGDKSDGQLRKPGRSGSSGQHRGFSSGGKGGGGGGSGGAPPPPLSSTSSSSSSILPSLSSNRSFKKSGNGQGGQPRLNQGGTTSEASSGVTGAPPRAVQNGAYKQIPSHDAPARAAGKPVDMPLPRTSANAVPRGSSSSHPAGGALASSSASTPPKGDSSRSFTLQFGSISPGIMNGMQIPARTSSAPPNLDEQNRDQARHDTFRAMPTMPLAPATKQQEPPVRKDTGGSSQSNTRQPHHPPHPSQPKRDVHLQVPPAPTAAPPKSSVVSMNEIPMSIPFQHQKRQIPMQFGVHNSPMQSQGIVASSLQMTMSIPVGNAPQVPQQIYVPGIQAHALQQHALMHQGLSMGFGHPMGHQLGPPLGNLGMGIGPQYPQQQPGKFGGPRKTTVKITDPDTHKEVSFDNLTDSHTDGISSGQRSIPNAAPKSQSIPTFSPAHQINYYSPLQPNSYNPSAIYFPPPTTVPVTNIQMPPGSQAPRYSYPVNQSGQPITFMNPSVLNSMPSGKPGPQIHTHGVSVNLETLPVSVPSVSSIISPRGKAESTKLLRSAGDTTVSFHQTDTEVGLESVVQSPKSISEMVGKAPLSTADRSCSAVPPVLSTKRMQQETSSSACVTSVAVVPASERTDGNKREPNQINDPLNDHKEKLSKDVRDAHEQPQSETSDSTEDAKSSIVVKDSVAAGGTTEQAASDNAQSFLVLDSTSSTSNLPTSGVENRISLEVGTAEFGGVAVPAISSSEPDEVSVKEIYPSETSTSLSSGADENVPNNLDLKDRQGDMLVKTPEEENLAAKECGETKVCSESSQNFSETKICPISSAKETSDFLNSVVMAKQGVGGTGNYEEVNSPNHGVEKHQLDASKEAAECRCQDDSKMNKSVGPAHSDDPDSLSNSTANVCKEHSESSQNSVLSGPSIASVEAAPISNLDKSEGVEKMESKVVELSSARPDSSLHLIPKEKIVLEITKGKTTAGKKKKRKEILSKADAAGTSDLYNAYKGPEERHQSQIDSEHVDSPSGVDLQHASSDETVKGIDLGEEDRQSKVELDDWEDAADVSTPRLKTSEQGQQVNGTRKLPDEDGKEATDRKKYSKDFLLTFAGQYTNLPVGFEIGSDLVEALMSALVGKSYVIDRDRGSGITRGDRRMVSNTDDDKWTKLPGPFSPVRDSRLDISYGSAVSFRPGQGGNHGVLRNPRGQSSSQSSGGILSGPTQLITSQGGMPRSGSDVDRWQHATGFQRGLISSPITPLQAMHKAERKYEVGKVSDQEQAKQRQLKAILNKLTPQNFEKLFTQVKEVNIDNPVTLSGVISQIFDKALTEPTFCEMYANFCHELAGALPDLSTDNEKITFKRLLLNKCQEEFERGEIEQAEANKTEEEGEIKQSKEEREEKRILARRRMLGNIRLIGELYKKKMLTEKIMHECIKKLLGPHQNPDEEDIEALCKLMSTIGEIIDHPKAKEHMDAYFDMMLRLSTNQKLSSRVRFMLKDAIDLRKNKWQQRRKVEGPKKIEEVHRDAAQERQAQASRSARGPVISSVGRRGPPAEYGHRGSTTALASPGSQQIGIRGLPAQVRGYGNQDFRSEDRNQFENRTALPLPQRPINDDSITLGPQGGLARGMSTRGQPSVSNLTSPEVPPVVGDHRRIASGTNSYNSIADWTSSTSREDTSMRYTADRLGAPYGQPSPQDRNPPANRDFRIADRAFDRSAPSVQLAGRMQGPSGPSSSQDVQSEVRKFPEEVLQEKSMLAIREFYSAKDEEEVVLCVKELNAPSFYPLVVSIWITDSFERKDMERNLLAKLLVSLCKSRGLLSQVHLIQGLESVLSTLEDAVNDAPRAAEFLGRLFAKFILENMVSLGEIGRMLRDGGEKPGRLLEIGIASDVLAGTLGTIRTENGDSFLNEIRASSNFRLEDFRPPHPIKSKLDAFL